MTPDELQRILDNQAMRQRGNGPLYFVALCIVVIIIILIYAQQ